MIKKIKEELSGPGSHPDALALMPSPNPDLNTANQIIRVTEPILGERETQAVLASLESGFISSAGEAVSRFESLLALQCDTKQALATTSGTHALDLLMYALDVQAGDEVIVPALTFISVGATIARAGGRPVFVDVDKESLNLIPQAVEDAISPATKGIIAVHTFGHPCDMNALRRIADKHELFLIEDACEALGAQIDGKPVGGLGDAAVHSFYANKMITTGNGGAITTNNDQLSSFLRNIRGYSYEGARFFWHHQMPFNARMSALQAAVGCAQLERLPELVEKRRINARSYDHHLGQIEGIQIPSKSTHGEHVYWMYTIHSEKADQLRQGLAETGIETRPVFSPLHVQPILQEASKPVQGPFPNSEWASKTGINLPSGSGLSSDDVHHICDRISSILN